MPEHTPECEGCGTTVGLFFFPRHGLFLCEPCARHIARILKVCQEGLTMEELEFRLKVKEDQGEKAARPDRERSHV